MRDASTGREVVSGPYGDVQVPVDLQLFRPDGFLLRWQRDNQVAVDVLGPVDGQPRCRVVARLAFTYEGFEQFVAGLVAAQSDIGRPF
jgi:hypothetical protein